MNERPDDSIRHSPSADRNKSPILEVLSQVLPARGLALEIASGTGQHVTHFAAALPGLVWQPSDPEAPMRASIDARVRAAGLGNVRAAIALDAGKPRWPIDSADAVVCINMLHIAPWAAALGLMAGAAAVLSDDGLLFLYGPYRRDGRHTSPGNARFDDDLRGRDPEWGLRDLDDVRAAAASCGLALQRIIEMPANNLSLVFRRTVAASTDRRTTSTDPDSDPGRRRT
jgi:SAM-dependent methyltransferase